MRIRLTDPDGRAIEIRHVSAALYLHLLSLLRPYGVTVTSVGGFFAFARRYVADWRHEEDG